MPPARSEMRRASFHSDALGADKDYLVWLPAAGDGGRHPVVTLLHGLGGDEADWERLGVGRAAAAMRLDAIIVMPDGDDGFYANWARPLPASECLSSPPSWRAGEDLSDDCVESPNYEDYVVRDLVAHVDAEYPTIPRRESRGIGGLSMGGFGALSLAMRHRDVFSVAVSHSGAASILLAGPHPYAAGEARFLDDPGAWGRAWEGDLPGIGDHLRRILGTDLAGWREHDPATLAASLEDGQLAIYLDCGTEDSLGFEDQAQHLHEVLDRAGVRHELHLVPGEHDDRYFASRVEAGLAFMAAHLRRDTRSSGSPE